jgi:hypothetical protein
VRLRMEGHEHQVIFRVHGMIGVLNERCKIEETENHSGDQSERRSTIAEEMPAIRLLVRK